MSDNTFILAVGMVCITAIIITGCIALMFKEWLIWRLAK